MVFVYRRKGRETIIKALDGNNIVIGSKERYFPEKNYKDTLLLLFSLLRCQNCLVAVINLCADHPGRRDQENLYVSTARTYQDFMKNSY